MLKQKSLTLNPSVNSQHGFINEVKDLLNEKNQTLSEIINSELKNFHVVALAIGAFCAALSFIFLLDQVALYGWAAFLGVVAVNCFTPIVRAMFEKGGARK